VRLRVVSVGFVAGAAAFSLVVGAGPGVAAAPRPPAESIADAGSDVAYFMVHLIDGHYQASSANLDHDKITTIPPYNTAPFPASVTVPADAIHPAKTWDSSSAATTPPLGGSAAVVALQADTTGQIDIARATSSPKPGETSVENYWAYALGAVDYVTFPGTRAPAGLDVAQLQGIYTCNPATGVPYITDWSQVGGKPGGIVRYAPPVGSGTLSFFQTKLLGGQKIDQNCDSSHLATQILQDDATSIPSTQFSNAIFAFEWGDWRAQKTGFSTNRTNGAVLGKFGATATTESSPSAANVNETSSRYFGTRYIYNVSMKTLHPKNDKQQLNKINRLIGVRPAPLGPGWICSGKAAADISKAGYVPLSLFHTGGFGLGNSHCRLNPTPL